MLGTLSPVMGATVADTRDIAAVVREITGPRGLSGMTRPLAAKSIDLIAMALAEVLQSVLDLGGTRIASTEHGRVAVELWVEPAIVVFVVRFAGPAVPDWLITNWNRGEPPAVLAPLGDSGWGWLVVREAMDSVGQQPSRQDVLLFLEKRL